MASASHAARANDSTSSSASTPPGAGHRPVVDITAITTRDDFLLELGEVLAGQASVRPVDSLDQAFEHLAGMKRGQLLVIDAREVSDVAADIQRAQSQAPHATVLVFAETELQATHSRGAFAVLPLPLDQQQTSMALQDAMADAVARKGGARPADRNTTAPSIESAHAARTDDPTGSGSGTNKLLMIVGAGLVAALCAYLLLGKQTNPTPAAAPAGTLPTAATDKRSAATAEATTAATAIAHPAVETSLLKGKVDDLLEHGRLAMRERRYSDPAGDNALLYYRSAAAADPSNAEAADGLQRVANLLAARFDESISAGRFDEAGSNLANFKLAAPADSRSAAMDVRLTAGQISRALADGNLDRANMLIRQAQTIPSISADQVAKWKAESARRAEDVKVQKFAALISDRMHEGQLIEPADDSARLYLGQLREAAPANAVTQRLSHELNAAYLHKAREAALANRAADSERWLTEAKAGGLTAVELSAFQKELAGSRQKAASAEVDRLAQLVRERARDGRLTEPSQDSAAYYLGQLQSTDANGANTAALSRDVAGQLVERARGNAQSGKNSAAVDSDLTLAKHFGADPRDILAVQQLQASARSPQSAAARTAAASGLDAATLAASLKRTRYLAPAFPARALEKNLSGVVTLEYTVDVKGDTRDIRVVEATPPGVFDSAAMIAVKHWHYDPVMVNGTAVDVPTRTAIRFELPK